MPLSRPHGIQYCHRGRLFPQIYTNVRPVCTLDTTKKQRAEVGELQNPHYSRDNEQMERVPEVLGEMNFIRRQILK
jgi:hypothetical protein